MAIEFVTGSNVSSAFDASGTSFAVDVGSGDNRLLVVVIVSDETNNPSAVTYNGVAMVEAVQYQHTTSDPSKVWIYYLVNPASGSNTLAVTFSSGTPDAAVMAAAFTGVDQDSPLDDTSTQRDTSSPFQVVVTPSTNDQLLIIGGGDDEDSANNRTPSGNTIELRDIIAGSGAGDYGGFMGYYVKNGASGNETLGYTSGAATDATLAGATFKPAASDLPPTVSPETSDNYETSDTTPVVEFTGTDSEDQDVVYGFQLDTVDTFASPDIDVASDADSGFVNTVNGGDTSPFNSGEKVSYTVQAGDELTRGLFYWRARGKDPSGTNTYGDWTTARKIIVFKEDREVTATSLETIPTNTNHVYNANTVVFDDQSYLDIDTDNATRETVTPSASEKVYFLQKVNIGGSVGFTVDVDCQVDLESAGGTPTINNSDATYISSPPSPGNFGQITNFTVNSGDDRVLILFLSQVSPGSVTRGSQSFTKAYDSGGLEVWYLINPDVGTASIVTDVTSSSAIGAYIAHCYNGVRQTDPIDNIQAISGSTSTQDVTHTTNITTTALGCLIAAFVRVNFGSTITVTVASDQTLRQSPSPVVSNYLRSSDKIVTGNGSQSVSVDVSKLFSSSHTYEQLACALVPSSISPSIKLDLWDFTNSEWVNQDEETTPTADTDFSLVADKTTGYADFVASGWVFARVYTDYVAAALSVDKFTIDLGVVTQTKTVQAKARIKDTAVEKTVQAKARIESTGITKTVQAKARIEKTETETVQARARIKKLAIEKTVQAKGRILDTGVTKTIQARAMILKVETETIQARARLLKLGNDKTVQVKSRIETGGVTKTVQARARILFTRDKTVQAKALILKILEKTVQAKALILKLHEETVSAKARIFAGGITKTVQARSRIIGTLEKTVQVKANISKAITKTVQAKARILSTGTTETVQAQARVKKSEDKTVQAKAKILILHTETVEAKARIETGGVTKSVQARSRIKNTLEATVQALARIRVLDVTKNVQAKALIASLGTTKTVQARARIIKLIEKTVEVKSRILKPTMKTAQARARILNTYTATIQAKSRIKSTGETKTIQARSRILKTDNEKTVSARASIFNVITKTISAKARLDKPGEATVQVKASIKNFVTKTVQVKARISFGDEATISALARILKTAQKTVSARARITKTNQKTIEAKALIVGLVEKTIEAQARILREISKTIASKARIFAGSNTVTVSARAKIKYVISKTISARTRIATTGTTKTISARARISNPSGVMVWMKRGSQVLTSRDDYLNRDSQKADDQSVYAKRGGRKLYDGDN